MYRHRDTDRPRHVADDSFAGRIGLEPDYRRSTCRDEGFRAVGAARTPRNSPGSASRTPASYLSKVRAWNA